MVLVAGIDPGVQNIGLVILDTEDFRIKFAECVNGENYSEFYYYFLQFIRNYKPSYVGFEKPYFTPKSIGKNIRTLELIGIKKLVLYQNNTPFDSFAPTTIKKAVTGNGHANKEAVIDKIHNIVKFSSEQTNNHITDAAGIAYTAYLKTNEI